MMDLNDIKHSDEYKNYISNKIKDLEQSIQDHEIKIKLHQTIIDELRKEIEGIKWVIEK